MNADFFHSTAVAKLIFSLGLLNFLAALAIFLTCRCLPTSRAGQNLLKKSWYQRVYKYHCYLWYILGASVVVHAFFAIMFAGVPF